MESFTSYLYLRIQHELFYRRKVDEIVSFVDMETFYRGAKKLTDLNEIPKAKKNYPHCLRFVLKRRMVRQN